MPVTIKVNGTVNSLVHKGSNGFAIATIPDICKTPSPGGPVPIPYPNIAQSMTLAKGTTTVKADRMMAAVKGCEFSLSNGDNAGVAGGVKSSTFMKEATFILYSFDVKMDGKNACRFQDPMFCNHQNTACLGGEAQPPVVSPVTLIVDASEVADHPDEACRKYRKKEVKDHDQACAASGMRKDDYDALRRYSAHKDMAISIRHTNPASTKHIGQGVYECKPSSVQTPTIKGENGGLTVPWPLPPAPGPRKRYCADYDMHDMICNNSRSGGPGSTLPMSKQPQVIREMNSAMNPTLDPMKDRIKHGPASTLGNYLQENPSMTEGPGGKRRLEYLNPMASSKEPLTVFDNGEVYQLTSEEEIVNMYKCKRAEAPHQWDLMDMQSQPVKLK